MKTNKFIIYKKYRDLFEYSYVILIKYPKSEKHSLANSIKETLYNGFKKVNYLTNFRIEKFKRIQTVIDLEIELKYLEELIRISYKLKFINIKNYKVWVEKIIELNKMIGSVVNEKSKEEGI